MKTILHKANSRGHAQHGWLAEKLVEEGKVKDHKHIGKGNKDKSYKRYKTQVKSFINEMGISEIKEITPEIISKYVDKEIKLFNTPIIIEQDGEKTLVYPKEHLSAADRLNRNLTSLKSLQLAISETKVLGTGNKKEIDFGDIQLQRNKVKEAKVFRAKGGSAWHNPTNREMRTIKDRQNKKAKEGNYLDQMAADFVRYEQITGARPMNAVEQTKTNFIKNEDGSMIVIHEDDKGGKTRPVLIEKPDEVKFLEDLIGKHDDFKVFQGWKKNGGHMSAESLLKRLGEKVKEVSEDIKGEKKDTDKGNEKVFTVETRITLHSPRKNYGTNKTIEYYEYIMKSPRETEKRIEEKLNKLHQIEVKIYEKFKTENPVKNKNDQEKLNAMLPRSKKKYEELVRKQNARNKNYAKKKGNKTYKTVKHLSNEEVAKYLASCDLGHHRTDVINDSYLDHDRWNKVVAKYKK